MLNIAITPDIWKNVEMVTSENGFDLGREPEIQMDVIWDYLEQSFSDLAAMALVLLIVLHCSAADEFSVIRKNKNKFRAGLKLSYSLNSIMRIKMVLPESLMECCEWRPSKELLRSRFLCEAVIY